MARCPNCGKWVYYMWVHLRDCIRESAERHAAEERKAARERAEKGADHVSR